MDMLMYYLFEYIKILLYKNHLIIFDFKYTKFYKIVLKYLYYFPQTTNK